MPGQCCVPQCRERGGHVFPKDKATRDKWIQAVKRGERHWHPSKWTTVCRNHFSGDDYLKSTVEGDVAINKVLKAGVVPHVFSWVTKQSSAAISRKERRLKKQEEEDHPLRTDTFAWQDVASEEVVDMSTDHCDITSFGEMSTQTDVWNTKVSSMQTEPPIQVGLSTAKYAMCDDRFHYYTGLHSYSNFNMIFTTFGSDVDNLRYYFGYIPSLSLKDQFFLTLVKLRLNRCNLELADMFKLNEKDVSNIFITWINFMYYHFKDLDWWPSRDLVAYFSPSDFSQKFPSTRLIIDGTEIPCVKPKQPVVQQATYSTYKNRNTIKGLIGVSPGGLVSYVSDIYCGSATDRQICERSSLPEMLDANDSVMADKGFNVQDLFIPYNVQINIPEYFRKN